MQRFEIFANWLVYIVNDEVSVGSTGGAEQSLQAAGENEDFT
jgi:hypothetical protein